jgi:drug/metabolite transporter, DME family
MAVGLLIYLVALYGGDTVRKFRDIPTTAMIAAASFFSVGSTLYVTSLTLVSTATIAVIGASSPIFTGLLSRWVTGERPGLAAWIAALMAFGGVGLIARDGIEAGNLVGMVTAILVPVCFAGQTLALRRYRNVDMVPAICVGGFVTFVLAGFLGFFSGHSAGGFGVSFDSLLLLAVMGPVQLSIPLIFYARGAKSVAAVTLSLIVMLDAVINPLWPLIFLREMPDPAAFTGGAIIIGAVLISIFGGQWVKRRAV